MDDATRTYLGELHSIHHKRLQELEKKAALLGSSTPPEIIIEIETIQRKISDLDTRLNSTAKFTDGSQVDKQRAVQRNLPSYLPRLVFLLVGIFLGIGGFWLASWSGHTLSNSQVQPLTDFVIYDRLGEDQISEQIDVIVDNKSVGKIVVDAINPEAAIKVSVPQVRKYSRHYHDLFTERWPRTQTEPKVV
jgi:hypothetical protein